MDQRLKHKIGYHERSRRKHMEGFPQYWFSAMIFNITPKAQTTKGSISNLKPSAQQKKQ